MAGNIDYSWDQYYSSGGTGKCDVKRVLKKRRGICGDYAFLMDTLCTIANITNVTVTGYAKDELFDVTDSLYIGNHAWNAVKLNNQWYVYDVTFSTGRRVYDFTRFSKFIIKLRGKLPFSIETKRVIVNPPDECCDTAETVLITRKVPRLTFFWWLLYKMKLHAEPTFDATLNTDYYLCEPKLFALTHYPENPVWTLLAEYPERSFEGDSLYYHRMDALYKNQQRHGAVCGSCDNALALQEIPKHRYEKKETIASNRKNNFSPGLHDYNIAAYYFRGAKKAKDSLEKVTALDSSLVFLTRSRNDFSKGQTNIDNEFSQQKSKNRKKYVSLLDDNRKHIKFQNEKLSTTTAQRKNLKELSSKIHSRVNSCVRKERLISKWNLDFDKIEKGTNESLIHQCRDKVNTLQRNADSLSVIQDSLQKKFEEQIRLASTEVWEQVLYHDSLIQPFLRSIYFREFGSDDYKKNIVETRKQLRANERKYEEALNKNVYQPSAACVELASKIFSLMDQHYSLQKERFETTRRLVKLGDTEASVLESLRSEMLRSNNGNRCWLKRRTPFLKLTFKGLKVLKKSQEVVRKAIREENHVESLRFKYVNKELVRRRKKYKIISGHNYRYVKAQYAQVKKHKDVYLSELRKLRREARKRG